MNGEYCNACGRFVPIDAEHACPGPLTIERVNANIQATIDRAQREPHPPSRRCDCAECLAYPWKDASGMHTDGGTSHG